MKLVIQIPCLNEAETLPLVLKSIPKQISGINSVEVLIINDGSTDQTVKIAKDLGVKHFVLHTATRGLARSFQDGLNKALELGADIIVNTDGDNQYPQEKIPELIQPILDGKADIVIADRQIHQVDHFSPAKKLFQKVGTAIVNKAASTKLPDAASGFRAYSRQAAIELNVVTRFSYAMETIIQAGNKRLAIISVPVDVNPTTRKSRLFKSTPEHIVKSGVAITRAFIMYRPYVVFINTGLILFVAGSIPFIRYLYFVLKGYGGVHHLQSLIVGSVLLVVSFIVFTLGIIADLIRINHSLSEDILEHAKQDRYNNHGLKSQK